MDLNLSPLFSLLYHFIISQFSTARSHSIEPARSFSLNIHLLVYFSLPAIISSAWLQLQQNKLRFSIIRYNHSTVLFSGLEALLVWALAVTTQPFVPNGKRRIFVVMFFWGLIKRVCRAVQMVKADFIVHLWQDLDKVWQFWLVNLPPGSGHLLFLVEVGISTKIGYFSNAKHFLS